MPQSQLVLARLDCSRGDNSWLASIYFYHIYCGLVLGLGLFWSTCFSGLGMGHGPYGVCFDPCFLISAIDLGLACLFSLGFA